MAERLKINIGMFFIDTFRYINNKFKTMSKIDELIEGLKTAQQMIVDLKLSAEGIKREQKTEFEAGKWYKYNDCTVVCIVNTNTDRIKTYGMSIDGWDKNFNIETGSSYYKGLTPATDKEVETMLIKESKHRGYEVGVNILSFHSSLEPYCDTREIYPSGYTYRSEENSLALRGGFRVFCKGKWAEIIEKKQPKEMTMAQINEALGEEVKVVE
jgi:hypothetical protein